MRPIGQWRHLMSSTVQIAPRTGFDRANLPTYGAAVQYQAKIYYTKRLIAEANRRTTSQDLVEQRVMHIDSADPILPTAQITLTTGDAGSTENWAIHPLISGVERLYDKSGAHSTIVYI